jgi:hypothetical protein
MMRTSFALGFVCLFASQVFAETPYIDDRSSPERVVESLYSAINRKEYARAWSYFGTPPVKDYDAFVQGFAKTESVEIALGVASSDGAAGTIYHEVPIALKARDADGTEKVLAGCYRLSQTSATASGPPFVGIQINKGEIKLSTVEFLSDAVPKSCGDGAQPTAQEQLLQKATQRFIAEQGEQCPFVHQPLSGKIKPKAYELRWKRDGALTEEPENITTLIMFECDMAAYNTIEVYYMHNSTDGLELLSLAEPDTDFKYEDADSSILKTWALRGLTTTNLLVNSSYEEATQSISMGAKWRGVGDASSSGTWVFRNGSFTLQDYEVDPTYDGEINPISIYKDGVPVALRSP